MELNHDNVTKVLSFASSFDNKSQQQEAERQLKQWEVQVGYHLLLQNIYTTQTEDLQIRWLATICFKNGIDKYWRSSRQHALTKEEKGQIILRALDSISEPNEQLIIQYADAIATIARFEYPNGWNIFENLISKLQKAVETEDVFTLKNTLVVMNLVIKIISSVRIGSSRKEMHTRSPEIVSILKQLYDQFFYMWTESANETLMRICYLCLKNLRRIMPEGIEQYHKNQVVSEFIESTIAHFQLLLSNKEKHSQGVIDKFVNSYSKLYISMLNYNPTSFILLKSSDEVIASNLLIINSQAQTIYEGDELYEKLALKSFSIMKRLTSFLFKKGALSLKQKSGKEDVHLAITKLNDRFFQTDDIIRLCDTITLWYMRLREQDLEAWKDEPEEWFNQELSSSWEFDIRASAENYFQDLIKYFPNQLTEYLLRKISKELKSDDVLTQDALLCSLQLSSYSIANNIDFNTVLQESLIPNCHNSNILQRRICLVISEWVGVQCSKESRKLIYEMLSRFIHLGDMVVKLSAVSCLKSLVDDWDFDKLDFAPFIESFLSSLLRLFEESTTTESKLFVMNTLSSIIEKCNPMIEHGVLLKILQLIPSYWESKDDGFILKSAILRMFKNLIVSMNEDSYHAVPLATELIRLTCTPESSLYSTTSEDGYEVWLILLQHLPTDVKDSEVKNLFKLVPSALLNSTEILPTILSIIRSYTLYMPELFVQDAPFEILAKYLNDMRDDSYDIFVILMEILIINPDDSIIRKMHLSGLLESMFRYGVNDENSLILTSRMFILFSRLTMSSYFREMIDEGVDVAFFTKWVKNLEYQNNARDKKINLIGLLNRIKNLPQNLKLDVIRKTLYFLEEHNEDNYGSCEHYKGHYLYSDIDEYSFLDSNIKAPYEKIRYQKLMDDFDYVFDNFEQLNNHIKDRNGELSQTAIGLSKLEFHKVNSNIQQLNQNTVATNKDVLALKNCIEKFILLIYSETIFDSRISWILITLYVNPFMRTHLLKEIKLLWPIYLKIRIETEDVISLNNLIHDALINSPSLSWLSSRVLLNLSDDNTLFTTIKKQINTKENLALFDHMINLNRSFSTIMNLIQLFTKLGLENIFLPNWTGPQINYIRSRNPNFKNLLQCSIKSNFESFNGKCLIQPIDYHLLNLWISSENSMICHYINLKAFDSYKTLPQNTIKLKFVTTGERKTRSMTQSVENYLKSFAARTCNGVDVENLTIDVTISETLHYNWMINYLKTFKKFKQSKITEIIESPEISKVPSTHEKLKVFEARSRKSTYKTKRSKRKRLASEWDLTSDIDSVDAIVDSSAKSTNFVENKKAESISERNSAGANYNLNYDLETQDDVGPEDTFLKKVMNESMSKPSIVKPKHVMSRAKTAPTNTPTNKVTTAADIYATPSITNIENSTIIDSQGSEIVKAPTRKKKRRVGRATTAYARTSTPVYTEPTEYINNTTEMVKFDDPINVMDESLQLFRSNLINKMKMNIVQMN
ncbi:KAP120 [Candida pseudojiufengensis]|uniref:KAP120 n=1 Tax=Candida pseudojiufengensis TaxID=497109 RepID=UPI002224C0E1|nr:KAP120 [Candida pseudojiufengensis]KAI5959741.1 KAP120 [Candida pseudojiufengensis]